MAWKPIATLKALWVSGFKPTGNDYTDLFDTCGRNYKSYTALLSQSGTAAPTATILQNEIIGAVTLTRISMGKSLITSTGNFPVAKTTMILQRDSDNYIYSGGDGNTIAIDTYASGVLSDDLLYGTFLEIRVYN